MNITASWTLEKGIEDTLDWINSFLCKKRVNCGFLLVNCLMEFTGNLTDIEEEAIDKMNPCDTEMTAGQRADLKAFRNLFKTKPYIEDGYKRAHEIVPFMMSLFAAKETYENDPVIKECTDQLQHLIWTEMEERKKIIRVDDTEGASE